MIPNKSSFKFQELTPITGVKPYVLRFWETEFPDISPVMSDSGQKIYARKDVEAIFKIKQLLFEEKLTIPEAKQLMQSLGEVSPKQDPNVLREKLEESLELVRSIKAKRNW